jgi:hypothetical protein
MESPETTKKPKFSHYGVEYGKRTKLRSFSNFLDAQHFFSFLSRNINKRVSLFIYLDSKNRVLLRSNEIYEKPEF